jgi:DNA repair exonuclease SbcCD nuclease subunit
MKWLLVGDPHAVRAELGDLSLMRDQVLRLEKSQGIDHVVYLGDLYDNFGLKDVEVERFWQETFDAHRNPAIAIVGNHDRPGDRSSSAHALQTFRGIKSYIVDHPLVVESVGFIPFYFTGDEFVSAANDKASGVCDTKVLICHQAVSGAKYDNGYPVEDTADTSKVPQENVMSGHLHTAQSFGKVWYPGSPRWRTVHDANKKKDLWVISTNSDGVVSSKSFESECSKLVHIKDPEDARAGVERLAKPGDRLVVDIVGEKSYIEERRKYWADFGEKVRIRAMPTEKRATKVKESDGVESAFGKYQESFRSPRGTSNEVLKTLVKERFRHA